MINTRAVAETRAVLAKLQAQNSYFYGYTKLLHYGRLHPITKIEFNELALLLPQCAGGVDVDRASCRLPAGNQSNTAHQRNSYQVGDGIMWAHAIENSGQ